MGEMNLRILCDRPLIVDCPDFLTQEECRVVIQAALRSRTDLHQQDVKSKTFLDPHGSHLSLDEQSVLARILDRVGELLQTPPHAGEAKPRCDFTAPHLSQRHRNLSLGLHLDTNRRPRRFATAILYLASLAPGAD